MFIIPREDLERTFKYVKENGEYMLCTLCNEHICCLGNFYHPEHLTNHLKDCHEFEYLVISGRLAFEDDEHD